MRPSILTQDADAAKARIRNFYNQLSPHFFDMWGPHLHDGYYVDGAKNKVEAQDHLVRAFLTHLGPVEGLDVFDIGCGMGATSIHLAREHDCRCHGVTLSEVQVEIARKLAEEAGLADKLLFEVRDAETLSGLAPRDLVWMVGVLGHLPDQEGFVSRAGALLKPGGRFLLADWMAGEDLDASTKADIVDPVLEGMLMPDVFKASEARAWFEAAGFRITSFVDFTQETLPTWDEGIKITQVGPVLKLATGLGTDAIKLLEAIRGMKKAMTMGALRYGVFVAEYHPD